jgi:predicted Rossmann fold nucleotide-binding protein DprA/Smf involved in DNA uptake
VAETKRNWREDLKVLRERMGGITAERKSWQKEQRDYVKAITEALAQGPRTIPQIASQSGLPTHRVMWHLMAMKKYGKIVEAGREGDYLRYRVKEVQQ